MKFLRRIEKQIYIHADAIVFTMEGAYRYIEAQKWTKEISESKVYYINNGVDNELFIYNRDNYQIEDSDLEDKEKFKIVYTGSIRKVNNLGVLLDTAKLIKDKNILFLVWGDGDELNELKERVVREHIENVRFKGRVYKQYIPYIISKADLNIAHNGQSELFRYGISFNKIFEYLAAGKPILCDFNSDFNPVIQNRAGVEVKTANPKDIASEIIRLSQIDKSEYIEMCDNALNTSKQYDFELLTQKLLMVINTIKMEGKE